MPNLSEVSERLRRRTVRVGVTGLARSGKTAFLTSVAANLIAFANGRTSLPALEAALAGRKLRVVPAPAGAGDMPRFGIAEHFKALAADPPRWPDRTASVSSLALAIEVTRSRLGTLLPPRQLRLEVLDYPGEWLLDLPLLGQSFDAWSGATLSRFERHGTEATAEVRAFLAFVSALPARAPANEPIAEHGFRLYAAALGALRQQGFSLLQPGRVLMPSAGAPPPWLAFFPLRASSGGLHGLLAARYERYVRAVEQDLVLPLFGRLDRLLVLVDLLGALNQGRDAFADVAAALGAATSAMRGRWTVASSLAALLRGRLPGPARIDRAAWAATKADHVAAGQRNNLVSLLRSLTTMPDAAVPGPAPGAVGGPASGDAAGRFAIASIRCTRDATMVLDGRPVSAVEGRAPGQGLIRSYPGEVPPDRPGDGFWAQGFFALPTFEPPHLGRVEDGVPHLGLDALLAFLVGDLL